MARERRQFYSPNLDPTGLGGKEKGKKREGRKERVLERQRVYLISIFSDDRSIESRREVGVFSYLVISCLKINEMVLGGKARNGHRFFVKW